MGKIRVLLADDHTLVRQGLRALLAIELEVEVVGEAANGHQTLEMVKELEPDVVVLDLGMPGPSDLEVTRQIRRTAPATKVLLLSLSNDDTYVRRLVEAGASGYLAKHSAFEEVLDGLRAVHAGKSFFSPAVAHCLAGGCNPAQFSPFNRKTAHLSLRELEVLQLISEGRANKQIAAELCISIKTVEKHRQQLMNKLGIHDIAGLTRHAIALGMIEQEYGQKRAN